MLGLVSRGHLPAELLRDGGAQDGALTARHLQQLPPPAAELPPAVQLVADNVIADDAAVIAGMRGAWLPAKSPEDTGSSRRVGAAQSALKAAKRLP